MGAYYIGIDVGTGSARACLIDDRGEILSIASKATQLFRSGPDIYEQSCDDIWEAICDCTNRVMADSGLSSDLIRGIGFDATCSLAVVDRETKRPISVQGPGFDDPSHSIILWADHRAREETDTINATGHKLLKYVGGTMSLEMEMPKILWLRNHMPPALFARCLFFDLPDYLTFRATGDDARSNCSVVCKMGFLPIGVDGSTEGWSRDFCTRIGLETFCKDNFAAIGGATTSQNDTQDSHNDTQDNNNKNNIKRRYLSAGQCVAGLSHEAAAQMGLSPGTPVGSGVIDAYAGWAGTVGASVIGRSVPGLEGEGGGGVEHRLAAVAGTSTCHLVASHRPIFVPGVWGPYRGAMLPDLWMAEGGQSATGSLLHHVITTHAAATLAEEEAGAAGLGIFDFLNRRLEDLARTVNAPSIAYLIRHTFLYPDYHGNRSPLADPDMRGVIVGLGMDADVDALATHYYAALEAIAMQNRHIVDVMNAAGHEIRALFVSGGQCRNALLMRLLANCTGLPVVVPQYVDAAVVLGAAFLGVVAATQMPLQDVMERMSRPGTVIEPTEDQAERALLECKYRIFLDMADTQRKYRASVDALD